jgi:peptidoglycan/xylan/chitin deacetylase (PgdA/CDA1 family)
LRKGVEHDIFQWSYLPARGVLRWPDGAPLALAVIILVEHFELYPPEGVIAPPATGGFGQFFPFPNLPLLGHREYGHRVGIFRLFNILQKHAITPTVAIDAMAAERYPHIVEKSRGARAEFVAHGISLNRAITAKLSAAEESAYIKETLTRIGKATGQSITGWMGPEQCESERTAHLLDEAGLDYVCDWPNDEQPYFMSTPSRLVSIPPAWGLDDGYAIWGHVNTPDAYGRALQRSATQLMLDGRNNARTMVLVLRPWLSGQAFRVAALDEALRSILSTGNVWAATTGEIARAYRAAMK